MYRRILSTLAAGIIALTVVPASAATYKIDDVLNLSANGFRTSVFHKSSSNYGMSGAILDTVKEGTASGMWNSTTGAFNIAFDTLGGNSVTGSGNLLFPGNGDSSIIGQITFNFSNAIEGATSHTIKFLDWAYGASAGAPNGYNPKTGLIALWGSSGTPHHSGQGRFYNNGLGADFRIKVSAVPLPLPILMLLSGLVGLGVIGHRRNKAKLSAA